MSSKKNKSKSKRTSEGDNSLVTKEALNDASNLQTSSGKCGGPRDRSSFTVFDFIEKGERHNHARAPRHLHAVPGGTRWYQVVPGPGGTRWSQRKELRDDGWTPSQLNQLFLDTLDVKNQRNFIFCDSSELRAKGDDWSSAVHAPRSRTSAEGSKQKKRLKATVSKTVAKSSK